MPRFDYQCEDCSEEFEYFIVRSDDQPHCPKCSSVHLRKKVSLFAVGGSGTQKLASKKVAPAQSQIAKKQGGCHGDSSKGHSHNHNHGSCGGHSHSHSHGQHVGCGRGYADTLRKKYGY